MNKKLWVGLDVGVNMTAICAIDNSGVIIDEINISTSVEEIDQYLKTLNRKRIELIAMEAGATSTYLTRGLSYLKYPVALFECRQISKYLTLKQNKTDRNDARCIAEVARSGRSAISEVIIKTQECQRIRSLLATRQQLVRMRVGLESAIGSQFNLYGGKLRRSRSGIILRQNVNSEITRILEEQAVDLRLDIEPIVSICENLRTYIEHLDRTLSEMANAIEICRRFMEIPGVGPIIALSFYSAICDPHRFKKCNDVGAYLGLVPRIRQSGGSIARFRISRMGNTMTRQHMSTAAMILLRSTTKSSQLKNWGVELRGRRGAGRARLAVARKLSVIMLAMWKHDTAFDPFHSPMASGEHFS